jgi:phospholipid-binding lipoprotein MlaA
VKSVCWICFFLALCLVILPGPCTGSPPPEIPVSMLSPDEAAAMAIAMAPSEPSSEAKPLESFHPGKPFFSANQEDKPTQITDENTPSSPSELEEPVRGIADPLEPVNRAFFHFNDKLYFWVLKPIATGYKAVIPEDGRVGVQNFFSNLTTPVRLVNCLLQARLKGAGNEAVRFLLNTTLGMAGFLDLAKTELKIGKQEADFGQTLGVWGMGPAFYINWPILGPSTLRETVGYVGDLFLDPRTYLPNRPIFYVVRPIELVNETSLMLGEYENLKKAALDPYIALREAYHQYRQNKIGKSRNR